MQASDPLSRLGASLKSLGKMLLQSRPCSLRPARREGPIIIMGNGPSLRAVIDERMPLLQSTPTMAVNFAANAPEFTQIAPAFYILADPHFFLHPDDENVKRLWQNLASSTWQMTLLVPARMRGRVPEEVEKSGCVTVSTFNFVGVEGYSWLERPAYGGRLGMPRPRNVLVPAIMCAIWLGFKEIYVVGADHTWISQLAVTDDNRVVTVQPHFYKEDKRESTRVSQVYAGVPLHEVVESFAIALKSYHDIAAYARTAGVQIYNATPVSMIDAFERRQLPK